MVVHVRKLLFNKYMKNHKIIFYLFNKVEEKKIIEEQLIPLHSALKKKIGICIAFIVFMINLENVEINYQRFSLSLS